LDQSEKPCVACAEAIKKDAVLCRYCNTRQDDQTFKKQKFPKWLVPAVGSLAVVGLIASAVAFAPSPEVQTQEIVEVETETLENGVQSPVRSENSDHDYLLDDLRIPRLETCEEWDEFWVYEGPAVSFAIASLYDEPMLAVSTQIYKKNIHLDADNDGVLCFFENEAKPLAPIQDQSTNASADESEAELDESWKEAVLSVREAISVEQAESHPLDFAVSPSVVPSHATIVRDGVETALRFWAPYIESDIPLAMTVVHPKDKQWFMKRWEQLGRDNTGEFWWDKAIEFGGGAVGTTRTGIPNMYFMTSEAYVPPRGRIDYYVHEVTHFFQSLVLGTKGEAAAPCWYFEGTANFIGFAMTYPGGEATTMGEVAKERSQRAKVLMDFYENNGGLTSQRLERDVLNFPPGDDTCQHEAPAFGYNLGMFVSEKLLIDFGFAGFVKMSKEMARLPLPEAFAKATGVNYDKWVRDDLFPYLLKTLPAEAR
jgi:hypothetical protein